MNDLQKILDDVIRVSKRAGEKVMSYYDEEYEVTDKGGDSPVTIADIESNKIILRELSKYEYGVLSEETTDDSRRLDEKRVWIIDPMDGTKDFIHKTGEFTVMIGLVEDGKPVLGVVYQPVKDTLYFGIKNEGSYMKIGKKSAQSIYVSKKNSIKKSRMVSSRYHRSDLEKKLVESHNVDLITSGSAGLKLALIAEGKAEFNFNPGAFTWEWDVCAADVILSEAGGRLTDSKGNEFVYNKKNPKNEFGYVGSNGLVHSEVIGIL